MIRLFLKEYRSLLPLQVLMILTESGDIFYRPWLERLDEASWTHISSYIEPGEGASFGLILLIFGLLVAYSLFPREHDEKTIEFLYSLPVSRLRIFLAKAAAGWTVLVVSALCLQLTDFLLQASNPQSFSGEQWRPSTAAAAAFLHAMVAGIILCHGLLISFLRRFGLIPYAIAGWIVISLERISPAFTWLNFTNLLSLEYEGQRVVIPWGELSLHIALALLTLAAAYVLWTGAAERFVAWWERIQSVTAGRIALGCTTFVVIFAFCGLAVAFLSRSVSEELESQLPDEVREPTSPSMGTNRVETARFTFTYPSSEHQRVSPLLQEAGHLHERLRQLLGAEPGGRIVVDMTDESGHHQGITAWTTMRVGLLGIENDDYLRHVFAHELTHAFQFQMSNRRMADNARATQHFCEGSAEHYAHQLAPMPDLLRASRRVALASWERHRISFEDLADNDRLEAEYDPHLVYTLGETWTAALVAACGGDAPGRVLRAMARDDAPRDLDPLPFWQHTLQVSECDSEEVALRWQQLLTEGAAAEREFLDALPRLGGGIADSSARRLTLLATMDRPPLSSEQFPTLEYIVRVRDNPAADDTQIRAFRGARIEEGDGRSVRITIPRAALRGRRFQFQLGILFHTDGWAWFERWQWAEVP